MGLGGRQLVQPHAPTPRGCDAWGQKDEEMVNLIPPLLYYGQDQREVGGGCPCVPRPALGMGFGVRGWVGWRWGHAHLLSVHLDLVVGGGDDDVLGGKVADIHRELVGVAQGLNVAGAAGPSWRGARGQRLPVPLPKTVARVPSPPPRCWLSPPQPSRSPEITQTHFPQLRL